MFVKEIENIQEISYGDMNKKNPTICWIFFYLLNLPAMEFILFIYDDGLKLGIVFC